MDNAQGENEISVRPKTCIVGIIEHSKLKG